MAIPVHALTKKLRLLYGYSDLNGAKLALRIGRAGSTISEWAREGVSEDGLEALVELLVETLGATIDADAARKLWLGPTDAFAHAFNASPVEKFLDLLASAERKSMLDYLSEDSGKLRLVKFSNRGGGQGGVLRAKIGQRFVFDMTDQSGRRIVLFVESASGIHLGVPASDAPERLDRAGRARLPDPPGRYQFQEPKGLHRFLAFSIDAKDRLSISAMAGREAPLFETELETFVAELTDKTRVSAWVLDIVLVDVQ